LSPRIFLAHSIDPSITEYIVQNPYSNGEWQLFLSLGSGSTIQVTQVQDSTIQVTQSWVFTFFLSGIRQFNTLHFAYGTFWQSRYIVLKSKIRLPLIFLVTIWLVVFRRTFIDWSHSDGIRPSVLMHILSHDLFIISSEDDLFSYINMHICSDPEYLDLLHFIRFEYLSADCISSFISVLPDSIDHRLWESISRRLESPIPLEVEISPFDLAEAEFPWQMPTSSYIFTFLTRFLKGDAISIPKCQPCPDKYHLDPRIKGRIH
jgi:hypothetical protein